MNCVRVCARARACASCYTHINDKHICTHTLKHTHASVCLCLCLCLRDCNNKLKCDGVRMYVHCTYRLDVEVRITPDVRYDVRVLSTHFRFAHSPMPTNYSTQKASDNRIHPHTHPHAHTRARARTHTHTYNKHMHRRFTCVMTYTREHTHSRTHARTHARTPARTSHTNTNTHTHVHSRIYT